MHQYSLFELSSLIEDTLSPLSQSTFWVRAEIASLTTRSGHAYFDLVEKGEKGLIAAKMRANCWSNVFGVLSAFFEQETGQRLQTGMKVLLLVNIQYHAQFGLSLGIHDIDPRYTVGDLACQRQETIRRLQEEGVIDMQHTLTLPTLVTRLAVISSAEAAGYGDFVHQLTESGYRFSPTLFPAIVQGDKAETSVLTALKEVARREKEFDAVVLIRGGGATTDLACFDSYLLAATCAQFPLPVLTGIGHTRDVSVVDMVAFEPLKTPTAVAAFLIHRLEEQQECLTLLRRRLQAVADKQILMRQHRIDLLRQRLGACSPERIYRLGYSLATVDGHIITSVQDLQAGQTLTTHLADGDIQSAILS